MEQLRKALLQAEQNTTSVFDGQEPNGSLNVSRTSVGHTQYAAARAVDYDYTDTRIVELSATHLESNRIIWQGAQDEVVQAYKMLRTQILQKLKLNHWNSFAMISPRTGNGKSLTAINLAISLAQEVKHSVLLVDLDLRDPALGQYLGLDSENGITDYLLRDVELKDILVNPSIERLVVLPGHEPLSHSSEALGSPKMIALVEELKQRYPERIIIFDLPPMLEADDAIAFAPYVDAMLMVIEEANTTPQDLQLCADMLGAKPLLGSVLNKSGA